MKLSIEDEVAIQRLYNTYNNAADILCDAQALADCFVEDGSYEHPALGLLEGRDAIIDTIEPVFDRYQGAIRHWNNNLVIDASTDPVSATIYFLTIDLSGEAPIVAKHGLYNDQLVKTEDGWKFGKRVVSF